jgi:hypothetical protein
VLAVVHDQQDMLGGQEAFDRPVGGLARERDDRERVDDRRGNVLRSPDGRERNEVSAVREVGCDRARGLEREPCLADAAGPGEREQPHVLRAVRCGRTRRASRCSSRPR